MKYTYEYTKLEEDNWWFRSRNNLIYNIISNHFDNKNVKILDIGCGRLNLLRFMQKNGYGSLYGVDFSDELLDGTSDDIKVYKMDCRNMSFDDSFFDVVVASDVLEHIEDDVIAIKEIWRVLKKNGIFIVFVPAFKFLWSYHDVINQHKRRYTKDEVVRKLKENGFMVIKASYWNFVLFFPGFFIRLIKNIFKIKKNDYYKLSDLINKTIFKILSIENFLLKYINFPFGISVFTLSIKKEDR